MIQDTFHSLDEMKLRFVTHQGVKNINFENLKMQSYGLEKISELENSIYDSLDPVKASIYEDSDSFDSIWTLQNQKIFMFNFWLDVDWQDKSHEFIYTMI